MSAVDHVGLAGMLYLLQRMIMCLWRGSEEATAVCRMG